jgi:DNA-binding transcriptional MerR regulator
MPSETGFTITELAALTDIPVRTIRYYIAQGLLPSPGREGPSTRYDEAFLTRLQLINQLRAAHLPLAEIRKRLGALTDDEALALVAAPTPEPPESAIDYVRALLEPRPPVGPKPSPRPPASVAPPSLLKRMAMEPAATFEAALPAGPAAPAAAAAPPDRKPPTSERSQWERIVIEPDVELHVRRPLSRHQNRRVERLLAFIRELYEGE